jgi:serine phosphatase RsbU (regulator of sigma subunit)/anti-sigma regulatory factor (Ser/Thr protein kinase)
VSIPVGRGFAGRIAAQRRAVSIEDVDHAEILNPLLRERGIRSLLGVPLLVEGGVIGVLHIGTLRPRHFTEQDAALLQLAADRAAMAIDHARSHEQRHLAEALQRALLPAEFPIVPGVDLAGVYRPAAHGARLGGDWYDVFFLPDGRIGAAIGDVVGRGVAAAALMAQVRTALRAYALEGHGPSEVADRLNQLMRHAAAVQTATLSYVAVNHELGRATLVNAGHPPPVIVAPGEEVELLDVVSGPPLGASRIASYPETEVELPPGAELLFYTDGLVERRDEGIEDGLQRLCDVVRANRVAPRELCAAVLNELVTGIEQDDDVAVMAIQLRPLGDELTLTLPTRPEVLAGLRRHVTRWLEEHGASYDVVYSLTLATSEAAANAVEHAYGPGRATFQVTCSLEDGAARIAIRDEGRWRPERDDDRGRGLMLVRGLVDSVVVESAEGPGTTVVMRHPLNGGGA